MRFSKKTKKILSFVGSMLLVVILAGAVMNMTGVFAKESNPKNLVGVDALGNEYLKEGKYNTGYGVTVKVDDLGAVKVKGTATSNVVVDLIPDGFTLEAGKTYTLSCGNDNVNYKTFGIRLKNTSATSDAERYIYANNDGTFTVSSSDDIYKLEIYVNKDVELNETFYPVLVEGSLVGNFYK